MKRASGSPAYQGWVPSSASAATRAGAGVAGRVVGTGPARAPRGRLRRRAEDRWSVGQTRRRDRVPACMGRRARPAAPRGGCLTRCAAARARYARSAGRGRRRRGRRGAARPTPRPGPGRSPGPGNEDRAATDRRGGEGQGRASPQRALPGPERRPAVFAPTPPNRSSSTATSTSGTCSCASAVVSSSTRSPAPATAPTTRPTGSTPTGSRVAALASRRGRRRTGLDRRRLRDWCGVVAVHG